MKTGDEIILIVHGAGTTSKEYGDIIESIGNQTLTLENSDKVYHKDKDGIFKTKKSDDPWFGFWFEIKEKK